MGENRKLLKDANSIKPHSSQEPIDVATALEKAGFGFGTMVYLLGPLLLTCLEGAEIVILSIVSLMLKCEWNLSTFDITLLQVAVMLGMMLSTFLTSTLSDKYGRRPLCLTSSIGLTIFGVLSGFTKRYWQLVLLRGILGTFLGIGLTNCNIYLGEISTVGLRAMAVSLTSLASGIGASIASAAAYFVVEPWGWQGLMITVSLIFSPSIIVFALVNESPRFDALRGNIDRAEKTVTQIAALNCKSFHFSLKEEMCLGADRPQAKSLRGHLAGLREDRRLLRDILAVAGLSVVSIWLYYSTGYSVPRFLNEGYCTGEFKSEIKTCIFYKSVLFDLGVISLFEPLGVLVVAIVVDLAGRRLTFAVSLLLLVLNQVSMLICVSDTYLFVMLMINKMLGAAIGWSFFIYLVEYFPTSIRGFTTAVCVGSSRVGAGTGMFTAQFVFNWGPRYFIGSNLVGAACVGLCLFVLKRETMGVQLEQS